MIKYITSTDHTGRTFFYGLEYEHIKEPPRLFCLSWDDAVDILKERGLPITGYSGYVDNSTYNYTQGKMVREQVFSGFNYFTDASGKIFAHHSRDLGTLVIY